MIFKLIHKVVNKSVGYLEKNIHHYSDTIAQLQGEIILLKRELKEHGLRLTVKERTELRDLIEFKETQILKLIEETGDVLTHYLYTAIFDFGDLFL